MYRSRNRTKWSDQEIKRAENAQKSWKDHKKIGNVIDGLIADSEAASFSPNDTKEAQNIIEYCEKELELLKSAIPPISQQEEKNDTICYFFLLD